MNDDDFEFLVGVAYPVLVAFILIGSIFLINFNAVG